MRCSMCGYEFDQSLLTCHGACPLGAHCMVICCPRCGYSTVDPARSGFTRRVLHLFGKDRTAASPGARGQGSGAGDANVLPTPDPRPLVPPGSVRLLDLKPGQAGHVADLGVEPTLLAHLSHYGLLPGTPIRLARKYPMPIVQVGQTDLALDRSVAARIYVDMW